MPSYSLRPVLAESIPTDVIRESGFADWVVYLLVFLIVADRLKSWFVTPKRDISGSIEMREGKVSADADEMEDELNAIKVSIDALKLDLATKHEQILAAGDKRAEKITNKIDAEIKSARADTERMIAEVRLAVTAVQMSAAAHQAQIEDLKARDHSHDTQLIMLRNNGTKPR
jgi:hypothetical protein